MQQPPTTRSILINTDQLLRAGNCSSVFAGTFVGRSVAVERIKKTLTDQTVPFAQLAQLNHPNIVKFFQTEEDAQFR